MSNKNNINAKNVNTRNFNYHTLSRDGVRGGMEWVAIQQREWGAEGGKNVKMGLMSGYNPKGTQEGVLYVNNEDGADTSGNFLVFVDNSGIGYPIAGGGGVGYWTTSIPGGGGETIGGDRNIIRQRTDLSSVIIYNSKIDNPFPNQANFWNSPQYTDSSNNIVSLDGALIVMDKIQLLEASGNTPASGGLGSIRYMYDPSGSSFSGRIWDASASSTRWIKFGTGQTTHTEYWGTHLIAQAPDGPSAPPADPQIITTDQSAQSKGTALEIFPADCCGNYSMALGFDCSSGPYSLALGSRCDTTSTTGGEEYGGALAIGLNNTASGKCAVAMGFDCSAGGIASFADGSGCIARGDYSVALGYGADTSNNYQFVVGISNEDMAGNTFFIDNSQNVAMCVGGDLGFDASRCRPDVPVLDVSGDVRVRGIVDPLGLGLVNVATVVDASAIYLSMDGSANTQMLFSVVTDASKLYHIYTEGGVAVSAPIGGGEGGGFWTQDTTAAQGTVLEPMDASGIMLKRTLIYGTDASGLMVGDGNTASGDYAVAMGYDCSAGGNASFADGSGCWALGDYAVAMGVDCSAGGVASFAMGVETTASGYGSTAMGQDTTASGDYSTAMGILTTASGDYSTAMGYDCSAGGNASFADGSGCWALGDYAVAMGVDCSAGGVASFAMGVETTASGYGSTAMGQDTTASGDYSTAMGILTTASGDYSTAMGYDCSAGGVASFADGSGCIARGDYSVALGYGADTSNNYQFVLGISNESMAGNTFLIDNSQNVAMCVGGDLGFDASRCRAGIPVLDVSGDVRVRGIVDPLGLGLVNVATVADASAIYLSMDGSANAQMLFSVVTDASKLYHMYTEGGVALSAPIGGGVGQGFWTQDTTAAQGTVLEPMDASGIMLKRTLIYGTDASGLMVGDDNTASGDYAVAMGEDCLAGGDYSTAMGLRALATGSYSTAMGIDAKALGYSSTVMGNYTRARGDYSTAMGQNTDASGNYSTAMGSLTRARGAYSVAMGYDCSAGGVASFADGSGCIAAGDYSVAMGYFTTASGTASTAMGDSTMATNSYSTAMGVDTTASGEASTAMGDNTTASGDFSTAMGYITDASGDYSTAMGYDCSAVGIASFADGSGCIATGDYSVAMGHYTRTDGSSCIAMGYNTTAGPGRCATAMGNGSQATGLDSVAMGLDTKSTGAVSTAMGYFTTASGGASTTMGYFSRASGYASVAMGDHTTAGPGNYSTAMGFDCSAVGIASFADGSGCNAFDECCVALGCGADASGTCGFMYKDICGNEFCFDSGGSSSSGGLVINGAAKAFVIPHPEYEGKMLRHACIEAPTRGTNMYEYQLEATEPNQTTKIALPSYFKHINGRPRVYVTPKNVLSTCCGDVDEELIYAIILTEKPGIFNVMVTGVRKDPGAVKYAPSIYIDEPIAPEDIPPTQTVVGCGSNYNKNKLN